MRLILLAITVIVLWSIASCTNQELLVQANRIKNKHKKQDIELQDELEPTDLKSSPNLEILTEEEIKVGSFDVQMSIISYDNIIEFPEDVLVESKGNNKKDKESDSNESLESAQGQKVKLMIQNNHPVAMWYLMPVSGEKNMPKDGKFAVNPNAEPPFLGKKFMEKEQHLVELIFYGSEQQSFRAFYVEAGTSMMFRNYDLGHYKEGDYVPFWSAKDLVVDNKIQLKNWLPFSPLSSPNVVLQNTLKDGQVQWVNLSKEVDFPKEKMHFVQAEEVQEYHIPVGTIR